MAGRAAISAAIAQRAERAVDVVKVMASGGNTTPGTDVLATQFTDDDLTLDISVPSARQDMLGALADRAEELSA